jgi:hypothetical protein
MIIPGDSEKKHQGYWSFPSGNAVAVTSSIDEHGLGHLWFVWDRLPPSPEDLNHYTAIVRPEVMRIVAGQQSWLIVEI